MFCFSPQSSAFADLLPYVALPPALKALGYCQDVRSTDEGRQLVSERITRDDNVGPLTSVCGNLPNILQALRLADFSFIDYLHPK